MELNIRNYYQNQSKTLNISYIFQLFVTLDKVMTFWMKCAKTAHRVNTMTEKGWTLTHVNVVEKERQIHRKNQATVYWKVC